MKAAIFSPAKNAMQSGTANTGEWELRILPENAPAVDPLMGWVGMPDTTQEIRLKFGTIEQAIEYANKNGIAFEVLSSNQRKINPKSYAANFAYKSDKRA